MPVLELGPEKQAPDGDMTTNFPTARSACRLSARSGGNRTLALGRYRASPVGVRFSVLRYRRPIDDLGHAGLADDLVLIQIALLDAAVLRRQCITVCCAGMDPPARR